MKDEADIGGIVPHVTTVHKVMGLDGMERNLRYTEILDGDVTRGMVEIWYRGGSAGYPGGAHEAYSHVMAWMFNPPGMPKFASD